MDMVQTPEQIDNFRVSQGYSVECDNCGNVYNQSKTKCPRCEHPNHEIKKKRGPRKS